MLAGRARRIAVIMRPETIGVIRGKSRLEISATVAEAFTSDNNVTWQATSIPRVFVRVDNNPEQLFAEGPSGNQTASWIEPGHVYVFILRDMNGNEIARDRLDVRSRPQVIAVKAYATVI